MNTQFELSTDKKLIDIDFVHSNIEKSYWGIGRTKEQTAKTIENSLCFGVYVKNKQVGFARVVTDYIFFGYFMDVIIAENYQGQGLGKMLVTDMLEHQTIKNLQTLALKTKDAHEFYEKYEFKKIGDSALWMSIDKQKLN